MENLFDLFDLFDLKAGGIPIKNPIALSAMAGITDSKFAASNAKNAGLVVLGAYNLDETSEAAGTEAAARGRSEFTAGADVNGDVFIQIENEIDAVASEMPGTVAAISVRSASLEPLLKAAELIQSKNAVMELDVHCRQPEFTERGLGQALLKDTPKLAEMIQKIKETGVVLSVKFRTNVVNPGMAAEFFDAAGVDIIHADAMIEGKGSDLEAIMEIRNATRKLLIANNSVDDFDAALDFFSSGADMVSAARAAADDPEFIPHLVQKISDYQQETGWYNAPKHICKRGDNRGLAFCCPPVKYCSLLKKIESVGFTPEEFIQLKQESVRGTPLEGGKDTCFGSLVWCCKGTKPCFYRDGTLSQLGISMEEYMTMKKELSEKILRVIDEKKAASSN
ncbi:Dihydroorotate dehydrogenase [Methanimicrococcus sp. At1]|uniref:Dihydroorotate dehydrogenase n=1 Tax=Methanimicrococcus hacksteinii TaxID=3028293 RepID=A0ABU3VQR9_9EURY|nr:methanogenesis marker 9 domain-containing protein [Methanimicrococcus sp. At1]MDV0445506.1 Dihydroorotate dehydrogenase [Methanimicrococcus sp. At1]